MADSRRFPGVSFVLNRASENLEAELTKGIQEYESEESTGYYTNADEIYEAIRNFLANWLDDSSRKEELTRRATFIERHCGPDSSFAKARRAVLSRAETVTSQKVRSKWDPEKRVFQQLRQANGEDARLARQVADTCAVLGRAIRSGVFQEDGLSVLNEWRVECDKVLEKAGCIGADGCRYLLGVRQYLVAEGELQREGETTWGLIHRGDFLGVPVLKELSGAAGSLKDWASSEPDDDEKSQAKQEGELDTSRESEDTLEWSTILGQKEIRGILQVCQNTLKKRLIEGVQPVQGKIRFRRPTPTARKIQVVVGDLPGKVQSRFR